LVDAARVSDNQGQEQKWWSESRRRRRYAATGWIALNAKRGWLRDKMLAVRIPGKQPAVDMLQKTY
jgi:hypothetical protein